MIDYRGVDPYNEISILEDEHFVLSDGDIYVPLWFKPDASFILRTVLDQEEEFTRDAIAEAPGFREVCEGTYPVIRFASVFSRLRFTLDALNSNLIQTTHAAGMNNVYARNPDYKVIDLRG